MKKFLLRLTLLLTLIFSISACAMPITDRGEYKRERDHVYMSVPNYSGDKWSFSAGFRGEKEYFSETINLALRDGSTLAAVAYRVEGRMTIYKDQLLPDLNSLADDFRPLAEKAFSQIDRSHFDSDWSKTHQPN